MRRYIIWWVLALCFVFGVSVEASEGNVDIVIHEEEEFSFSYAKVADYVNGEFILVEEFQNAKVDLNNMKKGGDLRRAAEELSKYGSDEKLVTTESQVAHIDDLSQGAYLIQGVKKAGYEIPSTLISIPGWDGEQEEMSYQVTIFPKIQKSMNIVQTGDDNQLLLLATLCLLSLTVVASVAYSAYFLKDK